MAPMSKERAWKNQQAAFVAHLDEMRRSQVKTDAILTCENQEFPVHQTVLSAASPYFQAMFQCPMKESQTGKVEMKEMKAEALDIVLTFIYSGGIPDFGDKKDMLESVLKASHLMAVQPLYEYCVEELNRELLNVEGFIQFWQMALWFGNTMLFEKINRFLCANFFEIFSRDEFLSLQIDHLKVLMKLEQLSADVAMKGILAWVKFDLNERKDLLEELILLVDLNKLSSDCLNMLVNEESLIISSQTVCQKLCAISCARLKKPQGIGGNELQPGVPHDPRLFFITTTDKWESAKLDVYDFKTKSWMFQNISIPSFGRGRMIYGQVRGTLYFVWNGNKTVCKCSSINYSFSEVGDLTHPVWVDSVGTGTFNDQICIGPVGPDQKVELFNPLTGESQMLPATNKELKKPYFFQRGNDLFACGNCNLEEKPGSTRACIEQFNVFLKQWTIIRTTVVDVPLKLTPTVCGGELLIPSECGFFVYNFFTKEIRNSDLFSTMTLANGLHCAIPKISGVFSGSGEIPTVIFDSDCASVTLNGKVRRRYKYTLKIYDSATKVWLQLKTHESYNREGESPIVILS